MRNQTVPARSRIAVVAGLTAALTLPFAPAAFATPEAELAAARAQLEQIGAEYQKFEREFEQKSQELQETSVKIDEMSAELSERQELLSGYIADGYKGGGLSLTEALFSSRDFDELVSNLFYMSKVATAKAQAIEGVKTLQAELEDQYSSQAEAMNEAEERLAKQGEAQAAAAALVSQLDAEVKAKLEAEAAQNEAIAAGIEASDNQASAPAGEGSGDAGDSSQGNSNQGSGNQGGGAQQPSQPSQPSQPAEPSKPAEPSAPSGGGSTGTSSVGARALNVALQYEGTPYVWGGNKPGGFDCSGIVQYSYKQIGYNLPRSSGSQREYIRKNGRWTTNINELQYGDLVFFPGHVAFYVGNGNCYGAKSPGYGAGTAPMRYMGTFLGGGNI